MSGWSTRYFTRAELIHSDTAVRLSINNEPSSVVDERLHDTALKMDRVREYLGAPVRVNSGYRGEGLNHIIGGSSSSAHTLGYAVDFVCPTVGKPLTIAEGIRDSGIKFDQLIAEGSWIHISFDPRMRQQCLTARFRSGKPTTYEVGLHA